VFAKTLHATHPDMMDGVSNDDLRDRYLCTGMFEAGKVNLVYSHNERFVIGGAVPSGGPLALPVQTAQAWCVATWAITSRHDAQLVERPATNDKTLAC